MTLACIWMIIIENAGTANAQNVENLRVFFGKKTSFQKFVTGKKNSPDR